MNFKELALHWQSNCDETIASANPDNVKYMSEIELKNLIRSLNRHIIISGQVIQKMALSVPNEEYITEDRPKG